MIQITQNKHKTWNFTLEDGQHIVTFEHEYSPNGFRQNRTIFLDSKLVEDEPMGYMWPLTTKTYPFQIRNHLAAIKIKAGFFRYSYHLLIDGTSVDTLAQAISLKTTEHGNYPKWVWIFYILGFIVTFSLIFKGNGGILGDGLAALLGVGGAQICFSVAKKAEQNVLLCIAKCIGITVVCWGIVAVLILLKFYVFRFV
jgi:hypothetical protein